MINIPPVHERKGEPPFIVIQNMINIVQTSNRNYNVPYWMTLTKIFKKFNVPLDG